MPKIELIKKKFDLRKFHNLKFLLHGKVLEAKCISGLEGINVQEGEFGKGWGYYITGLCRLAISQESGGSLDSTYNVESYCKIEFENGEDGDIVDIKNITIKDNNILVS